MVLLDIFPLKPPPLPSKKKINIYKPKNHLCVFTANPDTDTCSVLVGKVGIF